MKIEVDGASAGGGIETDPLDLLPADELEEALELIQEALDFYETDGMDPDNSDGDQQDGDNSDGEDGSEDNQDNEYISDEEPDKMTDEERAAKILALKAKADDILNIAKVKAGDPIFSIKQQGIFTLIAETEVELNPETIALLQKIASEATDTQYDTFIDGDDSDDDPTKIGGPQARSRSGAGDPPPEIPKKVGINMFQGGDPMAQITALLGEIAREANNNAKDMAMFKAAMNVAVKDMAMQEADLTREVGYLQASKTAVQAGTALAQAGISYGQRRSLNKAKQQHQKEIRNAKTPSGGDVKVEHEKGTPPPASSKSGTATLSSKSSAPKKPGAATLKNKNSSSKKGSSAKAGDSDSSKEPTGTQKRKTDKEKDAEIQEANTRLRTKTEDIGLTNTFQNRIIEAFGKATESAMEFVIADTTLVRDQVKATKELVQTTQQDIGAAERDMEQGFQSAEQAIQKHIESNNQVSRDIFVNFKS